MKYNLQCVYVLLIIFLWLLRREVLLFLRVNFLVGIGGGGGGL